MALGSISDNDKTVLIECTAKIDFKLLPLYHLAISVSNCKSEYIAYQKIHNSVFITGKEAISVLSKP